MVHWWYFAVVLPVRIKEVALNLLGIFRSEEGAFDPKGLTGEQRLDHLANKFVGTASVEEAARTSVARPDPLLPPPHAAARLANVNNI